jgi:serine/threonine-protein kinase
MSRYRVGDEPVPGYRLTELIGRGISGEVWSATGPGRVPVALKILAVGSGSGQRELDALAVARQWRHPNLVPILGLWLRDTAGHVLTGGAPSEPMEESLRLPRFDTPTELIVAMGLGETSVARRAAQARATGGIPVPEVLRYLEGAARAIDFLNGPTGAGAKAGPHCNINPENLLIVAGEVQVSDAGLVRALGGGVRMLTGTAPPVYAAPELLHNLPGPQTDLYALAIVYFELRTGRLPFERDNARAAHLSGTLDLSPLPPGERAVIERATSAQPARRYPNAGAMLEALKAACGAGPTLRLADEPPDVPPVGARRPRVQRDQTLGYPQLPDTYPAVPAKPEPAVSTWAEEVDEPVKQAPAPQLRWLWTVLGALLFLVGGIAVGYLVFAARAPAPSPPTPNSAP